MTLATPLSPFTPNLTRVEWERARTQGWRDERDGNFDGLVWLTNDGYMQGQDDYRIAKVMGRDVDWSAPANWNRSKEA